MGIKVEFNPDLALRSFDEYEAGRRRREECIARVLEQGKTYAFLKEGQRNYWLEGEIPLLLTTGGGNLSRPVASVTILEAIHFLSEGVVYTKGAYRVESVFDLADPTVHFEAMARR
jgi:hypothetical protein